MVTVKDLEIEEDIFDNPLISLHLRCMRRFGYIVSRNQRHRIVHLRKGAFFIASIAISCCLIFIKISRGFESLADGATSCATAFLYLSTTIATASAYFQRTRVVRMVSFLHDDITSLLRITDDVEIEMMIKTVKYLRTVTIIVWTPSVVAGSIAYLDCFYRTIFLPETVFNMPEVLNGTAKPILLFQLFPFGEVYDHFIFGYLGSCYALFLGITTIPCWHTFVTCLMKYIVVKYEIINKRLREYDVIIRIAKLSRKIDKDNMENMSEEELMHWHSKMNDFCVKEQLKIRWFVKELQSLIRIPVFMDFIIFSVLICFLFYALASGIPSKMDYLFMFIYLFVMALILWLYHWHATLIAVGNDDLGFALYSCPWYGFPVSVQKSLRLMMMESTRPLIMKAVFVELTLRTFIDNDDLGFALYSCPWYGFPVSVQKSLRLMMMESTRPLIMKAVFVELTLRTFIDVVRGAYSYFSILKNYNIG